MTFRCRVESGRIKLPRGADLPDGTEFEVQPVAPSKSLKRAHPAFGIWKIRTDIDDSVAFVRKLRARSRQRRLPSR